MTRAPRCALANRAGLAPAVFDASVTAYLAQVRAMPTYAQRKDHLDLWLTALGRTTDRASITPAMIRAVLQTWRLEHAAATCNKRRSALMHLWSVLDGKGARNPVRDVRKFPVDDAVPRGRDPHALDTLLLTARPSRSRAFCRVLLWTGMRPVELSRAQPEDLNLAAGVCVIRTAKGGRIRNIPLTRQAVQAWHEFIDTNCWRWAPRSAPLNRWLKRITGLPVRVYDLRHSYGTALARRQTRLDVIGGLMGHSTLELTKRYTLAALQPDAEVAIKKLARKAGSAKRTKKDGA
jgi:integrase